MTPGLAPRAAAWRVLHDLRRDIPLELALRRALTGLATADRRLAHEIAAGALRHRTALDATLAPHLSGGVNRVRPDLLDVLRLGAYQLRYLERVPRHAAVDTAVTLGRRLGGARVGGFVNAVLRKVAEAGPVAGGGPVADSIAPEALASEYSHPDWLVARWLERFGREETERLLRANNTRPPLVVQPARWSLEALEALFRGQGLPARRAPYDAGLVVEAGRPADLPGYAAGAWYVQDPAQALVTRFFAVPEGSVVFDACAAPGGKAVALAAGARLLLAADLRLPRVRRLRENLARAGSEHAAALVADAAHPPVRSADAVVFDAPCLGTGTFARHPDARWRVSEQALRRLAAESGALLGSLAQIVRPGGLLLFATCSLEPEENEVQIERFLAAHGEFRREAPPAIPAELLTEANDLTLLPQRHGTDGAYAARLRRVA